jgi:N-sulfoglucosamine sulfohydrolase
MSISHKRKDALNLLIITTDDLNYDSLGWMGRTPSATPHFDSFAKECIAFTHAHTTCPICQPSRSALMTGRFPHRNGALGFDPVNLKVPTLCEIMNTQGYFTAVINKSDHMTPREKFNWQSIVERVDLVRSTSPEDSCRNPANYSRDMLAAISAAEASSRPFFINVNIIDPHRPFYGTDEDRKMGGVLSRFPEYPIQLPGFLDDLPDVCEEVGQYERSVQRCDKSFGEIINTLEASGHSKQTLIVFISDHGMPFPFSKTTLYQSGTRTPLLLRWPAMPHARTDKVHMVSNIDVLPTILQLLELATPHGLDGQSLLPLLNISDDLRSSQDRYIFTQVTSNARRQQFPSRCIRSRRFSYIWNYWSNGITEFHNESMHGLTFNAMVQAAKTNLRIQSRVQHFLFRTPEEFYDLEKDPCERDNLIANPAYQSQIQSMKAMLSAQMKATKDPLFEYFDKIMKLEQV